jgi:hypothetical protein
MNVGTLKKHRRIGLSRRVLQLRFLLTGPSGVIKGSGEARAEFDEVIRHVADVGGIRRDAFTHSL